MACQDWSGLPVAQERSVKVTVASPVCGVIGTTAQKICETAVAGAARCAAAVCTLDGACACLCAAAAAGAPVGWQQKKELMPPRSALCACVCTPEDRTCGVSLTIPAVIFVSFHPVFGRLSHPACRCSSTGE